MSCDPIDTDRIVTETFVSRVEHHAMVASTNDLAAERAGVVGGELPLLVVADRQTAGRGRGSNKWWTGEGSLAFSVLLGPLVSGPTSSSGCPLAGLATAVAVVETVAPLIAPRAVGVHWPNDVMAAGAKLAGILVEVLPDGRQIVGVGLNANNSAADAPPELRTAVSTLRDMTHRTHDRTDLLVALLQHLQRVLGQLTVAPEQIAARADRLCLQRGRTLAVELGGQIVSGRCAGIAPDGALRLDTPQGRRSLYTGVVCR